MTTPCADVIATYESLFVVIKRLSEPQGLAFPGGKKESDETILSCAHREFAEETGLTLGDVRELDFHNEPDRDPRGHVSHLFAGSAHGTIRAEEGKTEIYLLSREELLNRKGEFVLDHYAMFLAYLNQA